MKGTEALFAGRLANTPLSVLRQPKTRTESRDLKTVTLFSPNRYRGSIADMEVRLRSLDPRELRRDSLRLSVSSLQLD